MDVRVLFNAAAYFRVNADETQGAKIQTLDKGLDHTNRIVLIDKIFKRFRKERFLATIQTLDKPLH